MTVAELVALGVGGGLGAGARYLLDGAIMRGRKDAFPLGILVVNVLGSLLLGILTALSSVIDPLWLTVGGVGVLGGFTTFSAVSVESVLLGRKRADWAWLNLLGTFVTCVIAAAIGFGVTSLFVR